MSSTITKTIVLKDNDTAVLPAGATIVSVAVDGFISVTSSCNNLPAPVPYKCYSLDFGTDISDDGGTDLMNESNITYYGIRVNGVETLFPAPLANGGDMTTLQSNIIDAAPYLKNVSITTINNDPPSYRERKIAFKAPQNLGSSFELIIGTVAFGGEDRLTLYVKAYEVDC